MSITVENVIACPSCGTSLPGSTIVCPVCGYCFKCELV